MNLYTQDGYERFSCLAGDCRHTCCQLWDILIDEDTAAQYQALPGPLGEKLRQSMYEQNGESFFHLNAQGFCHFLRRDGLCDLVVQQGDGFLCKLCREFPRFTATFSGRVEKRLSVACEAAGRLLLTRQEKARWMLRETDGSPENLTPLQQGFLNWRQGLCDIIQYRDLPLMTRVAILLPPAEQPRLLDYLPLLLRQEHLLPAWGELLTDLRSAPESWQDVPLPEELEIPLEQFAFYAFNRSLWPVRTREKQRAQLRYCVLMLQLLRALCARHIALHGKLEMEQIVEFARLYAIEMEHSYKNADQVRETLEQESRGEPIK